ncbi:MAG TPA: hypothetical protein VLA54_07285 [Acidimicrobiia bacterium]|nr:hypothetical protein [Acidimicrobiia bacterium]
MPDTELFFHLAEIAGVFVGFGALISIRSERSGDDFEVVMIRFIVWFGILVVVTALVPVILSQFSVTGHGLWVAGSVVYLVLWWGGGTVLDRMNPERTRVLTRLQGKARIRVEIPAVPMWLSAHIALVLVLLGVLPDKEPALYLTAVALALFLNALMSPYLVYRQSSK